MFSEMQDKDYKDPDQAPSEVLSNSWGQCLSFDSW